MRNTFSYTVRILFLCAAVTGLAAAHGDVADLRPHRTRHFKINHSMSEVNAANLGNLLESLYQRYFVLCRQASLYVRPPQSPLVWMFFDDAVRFRDFSKNDSFTVSLDDSAYYSVQENCVVVLQQTSTAGDPCSTHDRYNTMRLSHEMAHQLLYSTGLQKPGVLYPVWFSEGMAMSFETEELGKSVFCGPNPYRANHLVSAYREGRLLKLQDAVVVSKAPTDAAGRVDFYAQSWGLVQFLYNRDAKLFRRYLHTMALRPPGKRPEAALLREFTSTFGEIELLENEWHEYLRTLCASECQAL